jgi:hypothetical protein
VPWDDIRNPCQCLALRLWLLSLQHGSPSSSVHYKSPSLYILLQQCKRGQEVFLNRAHFLTFFHRTPFLTHPTSISQLSSCPIYCTFPPSHLCCCSVESPPHSLIRRDAYPSVSWRFPASSTSNMPDTGLHLPKY